jgi:predicted amidophosphoribosyltransferase
MQAGAVDPLRRLFTLLVPPLCATCGAACSAAAVLCPPCDASLRAARPTIADLPWLESAWAAAPHDGAARDLVAALKFRRLLPVAELIAQRIAEAAPPHLFSGQIVPVPPAPWRLLRRGFDPAEEISARLAAIAGLPYRPCLARAQGPRQVGRSRVSRLSSPPRIQAMQAAPAVALLVDDVQTTGATLTACAVALRGAGTARVSAVTFARTL